MERAVFKSTPFCRKDIPSANPANALCDTIAMASPTAVPNFWFAPKDIPAHMAWTDRMMTRRCEMVVFEPLECRINKSSTMSCFCPRTGCKAMPMRDWEGNIMVGQSLSKCSGSFSALITVLQFMQRAFRAKCTPSPLLQHPLWIGMRYFSHSVFPFGLALIRMYVVSASSIIVLASFAEIMSSAESCEFKPAFCSAPSPTGAETRSGAPDSSSVVISFFLSFCSKSSRSSSWRVPLLSISALTTIPSSAELSSVEP
mmetsp:Transcript_26978/g.37532  ORF Transcript_26978/g.37532 Transcript_26978/m.37532 type:complete len:257 (-) Transcript_26978:458-1228(-)